MAYLLSPGVLFGAIIMGICGTFFYIFGESERPPGWKWALISFAIWVFISLLLRLGLLLQIIGQLILFAILTWQNISRPRETRIIK
jgi:hypothetical protein